MALYAEVTCILRVKYMYAVYMHVCVEFHARLNVLPVTWPKAIKLW